MILFSYYIKSRVRINEIEIWNLIKLIKLMKININKSIYFYFIIINYYNFSIKILKIENKNWKL